MGLLAPGRDEKIGCVGWFILGGILIIGGVLAMVGGLFDALF